MADPSAPPSRPSRSRAGRPPLLTKRGGTLAGATVGLLVGSRLLGADELAVLGLAGVVIIAVAIVSSRLRRVRLVARRVLHPPRLQVGASGRIELELKNVGTRPTPLATLADGFDDGRRAARFLLAPVAPGATERAAYRVPTSRRGRFRIGPLVATIADPFGIARRELPVDGVADVVVCPRVHAIVAPGAGVGREPGPDPTASARGLVHDEHGEFRTLRDYEVGDELRRVHWRTTARTGRLVVRQDEAPWLPRVSVVLDVRPSSFDGMSFETAIEAAASVLNCLRRDRRPVELLTSTGAVLTGSNPDAPHAVLEQLATIEPDGPDRLVDVLAGLRSKRAGLVVAIVGRLDDATARALAHLAAHVAVIAVVVNSDSGSYSNSGPGPGAAPRRPSASFLVVDATDSPFPEAWNQAIRRWTSVAASSRLQRSRR